MSLSQGSRYPADAVEEFKATGKVVGFKVQDFRTDETPALPEVIEALKGQLGWIGPPDEDGFRLTLGDCWEDAESSITDQANKVYKFKVTLDGTPEGKPIFLFVWDTECEPLIDLLDQDQDWSEYLRSADCGDLEFSEYLETYGLHAEAIQELDQVEDDEDETQPCRVWVSYNYYAGSLGRPADGFLTEGMFNGDGRYGGDPGQHYFENAAAAREWVEEQSEGTYYLSNGEASRPDYFVCR